MILVSPQAIGTNDKMMEYLEFETTPINENCAQLGQPDYYEKVQKEIKKMLELLEKTLLEPNYEEFGFLIGYFSKNPCHHDFGTYYEIRYKFNENDSVEIEFNGEMKEISAWDFANFIEYSWPETWEDTEPKSFREYLLNK